MMVADGDVVVGGNRAHLRDHRALDGLGELLEFALHVLLRAVLLDFVVPADGAHGHLNAPLDGHGVGACRHGLHALAENRLRQDRRRRGAVTGHIGGLGRHFAHHLSAHVLQGILQFDLLGHGHAVFGDHGRTELLVQNHIATLGTQRHFHSVRQLIHAPQNSLAAIFAEYNLFCICHLYLPPNFWLRPASRQVAEFIEFVFASAARRALRHAVARH